MIRNITIKVSTIEYALDVLDAQSDHIRNAKGKAAQGRQNAYYQGMRDMMSLLITQAYENDFIMLHMDCYCKHSIKEVDEGEVLPRTCIYG